MKILIKVLIIFYQYCPVITQTNSIGYKGSFLGFVVHPSEMPVEYGFSRIMTH